LPLNTHTPSQRIQFPGHGGASLAASGVIVESAPSAASTGAAVGAS